MEKFLNLVCPISSYNMVPKNTIQSQRSAERSRKRDELIYALTCDSRKPLLSCYVHKP